jgi:hypothetical protein
LKRWISVTGCSSGWEVHFAPVTEVIHLGGTSTEKDRMQMNRQYFTSLNTFTGGTTRARLAELTVARQLLMDQKSAVEKLD